LGGDEFVILLSNIDKKELLGVSTRIQSSIDQPLNIHKIQVSASIGSSYTTEVSSVDLDAMIKEAGGDMYMEKKKGTGAVTQSSLARRDNGSVPPSH
jgi:diguanylate cyclase (GGDEF)-like protein